MVGQGAAPAGVLDLRTARTRAAPGLRPAATTGCLPGAWLTDGPRVARSTKSAAGAGRKTLRWRAERRPCSREGVRHLKNNGCATWRAIPPQIGGDGGEGTTAYPAPQRIRALARACITTRGCLTIESERRELLRHVGHAGAQGAIMRRKKFRGERSCRKRPRNAVAYLQCSRMRPSCGTTRSISKAS